MVTTDEEINPDVAAAAAAQLERMADVLPNVNTMMGDFRGILDSVKVSLGSVGNLTEKQSALFGAMSVSLIGVRKQFDNLQGIDTRALNTFKAPFEDLLKTINDSPMGAAAQKAASEVVKGLRAMGAPVEEITDAMKAGAAGISSYASKFLESADNGVRASNVLIQLAARTGDLGKVYNAAGPELEHFSDLIKEQNSAMAAAAAANQLPIQTIQEYYAALGNIPGALTSVVKSSGSASDSFSTLTGAIKLAKGTGQSMEIVMDDLKTAFKNYNITGGEALTFNARMTELNNKFGASFDVVRDSLRTISGDFVMFGNNAEGAAKILNNYVGGLKATGLSGDAAIGVVTNMTKSITQLSLAQRSFLSAQSGGPGGLMGGYKVEQMLRENKSSEVMDMVTKQIQKLSGGGKMVTVDEASKSQSAAAQLTRQTQMLQSFGIGKGSEAEAHRIIEGLRRKQEGGKGEDLAKDFTQDAMRRGTQQQQMTTTDFSQMRSELDGLRVQADIANFDTLKNMLGASPGRAGERTTAAQAGQRERLRRTQELGAVESGRKTSDFKGTLDGSIKGHDDHIKSAVNKIKDHAKAASTQAIKDSLSQIAGRKEDTTTSQKRAFEKDIAASKERARGATSGKMLAGALPAAKNSYKSPTDAMKAAAGRVAGRTPRDQSGTPQAGTNVRGAHLPAAPGKLGDIMVHITGYCIKCKQQIEGSDQAASINPASHRY